MPREMKAFRYSTNVMGAGYDEGARELTVDFKGGARYLYRDVPKVVADELMKSNSPGRYIRQNLAGSFPHERVR